MSDYQSCGTRDFSKYDALETWELEAILRQDAEATHEQESDTEKILYIAGVLASREEAKHTGNNAQLAWESFKKDYLPSEEDQEDHPLQHKRTTKPWVRRLTAAAAAIVLLVGLSATAVRAFGWEDLWNAVAKWAKETFSFVSGDTELTEPEEHFAQEYTSLQEALAETDRDFDLVPTWIPDGFELNDITIYENPMQRVYNAQYTNSDKVLTLTVRSYLDAEPEKVEIDDTLLEMYEFSGTKYYIFNNNQQLCALWTEGSFECRLAGELTVDTIKAMINSIGKG